MFKSLLLWRCSDGATFRDIECKLALGERRNANSNTMQGRREKNHTAPSCGNWRNSPPHPLHPFSFP